MWKPGPRIGGSASRRDHAPPSRDRARPRSPPALAWRVQAEVMHFPGGTGYTLEHDIQLYVRRAKAWPLALGDPRRELATVATRTFGPARSS